MQSHILALPTYILGYVLASYLNKVEVSFLWVGYGLTLHAGSEDCSYFYKHILDIQ